MTFFSIPPPNITLRRILLSSSIFGPEGDTGFSTLFGKG
jgi:hypothetical protein